MLVDPYRIVRRQHRDGAGQPDALGARRRRGKRDRRRGDRVVRPVVLAEAEHVEADAIGELDLLQHIGEAPVDIDRLARQRIAPGLDEGVSAELHGGLINAIPRRGARDVGMRPPNGEAGRAK